MAVPSSGELSLWGIAQEMIRNSYTAHQEFSPATNNDNLSQGTTETDLLLTQAHGPNATYGYFHPIFHLKEEDNARNADKTRVGTPPSQPDVGKGGDPSAINTPQTITGLGTPFGLTQGFDNARVVCDISLGGMTSNSNNYSSRVMSHAVQATAVADKFGPTTLAYRQTYGVGPDPDGVLVSPGETDSTIMYTIFRAGSDIEAHIVSHTPGLYSPHPRAPAGSPNPAVTFVDSGATVTAYDDAQHDADDMQPAPTSINTNNPSDNRPDTTSSTNQAAMSEWYSYDHDAVALATAGFYASTALFTGDGGTSLYHYTKNVSDFANGDVVNLPATFNVSLVLMHKQAASGTQPYHADLQLTTVKYNGGTYPLANPFPSNWTPGGFTNWLYAGPGASFSSQRTTSFDPTPATTAGAETVFNGVPSRAAVHPGSPAPSAAGKWNWQADGEGPSGGTGVPDPTGGFYWESSSGTRYNEWSILETPGLSGLTSDSVTFSMYRFGSAIGTAFMGIRIYEP